MVVDRKPTVESLGKVYADLVRDDESVRELWVSADSEGFIVSILTDEIDADHERRLYALASGVQQRFPDALFEVHVRNRANYSFDSLDQMKSALLPTVAKRIPLER